VWQIGAGLAEIKECIHHNLTLEAPVRISSG
jgi:hypothetical protein